MTRQQLVEQIRSKQSYLCVGLDTDITKIPKHLLSDPDPVFAFNKAIIDATHDLCVSYKINTAFYEAQGLKGWQAMEKTLNYIPKNIFTIADAKRGDIGNTSTQYAKAFFEAMQFDSITVAPYMGEDSVKPFLEYENKWAIVLGLTSNKGAKDFELQVMVGEKNNVVGADTNHGGLVGADTNHGGLVGADTSHGSLVGADTNRGSLVGENTNQGSDNVVGENTNHGTEKLYEKVLRTVSKWGGPENLMFVVGATQADEFINIRKLVPDHFFLVPGVGAQGGSLQEISKKAMNKDIGILVNVSRAIIYASEKDDFAAEARAIAQEYQYEMSSYLK